jgi:hypothetical protein
MQQIPHCEKQSSFARFKRQNNLLASGFNDVIIKTILPVLWD